jgi:hypothetical protein
MCLQPPPEEARGRPGVAPALHQDPEHHAGRIDRAPEIVLDAGDPDDHRAQMPAIPGLRPAPPQPVGEGLRNLPAPAPDRLVGTRHAALRRHQLNIPKTEPERVVGPDGVADEVGREAVTMGRIRGAFHPATMPCTDTSRHPSQLTRLRGFAEENADFGPVA